MCQIVIVPQTVVESAHFLTNSSNKTKQSQRCDHCEKGALKYSLLKLRALAPFLDRRVSISNQKPKAS